LEIRRFLILYTVSLLPTKQGYVIFITKGLIIVN